jgi:hypothetical protein
MDGRGLVTNEIAAGSWTMVGDGNTLQCSLCLSLSLSLSLNFFFYIVVLMEVSVLIEAIRNSGFNVRPTSNPRGNYVIFLIFYF